MARKPRLHYPGACYHVILRGNARQDVFFSDADRSRFYLLIQEGIERFGYQVHGFCLMTNHVHIALQVGDVPLSRIMQNLCSRYTRWVNWRLTRIGHLFHGRYKAILVDTDSYLTQLVSYIHLNPVRAWMVERCEDYEWSSHRTYVGTNPIPWLTTQTVLSQFSENAEKALLLFQEFVVANSGEGHRAEFHGVGGFDPRVFGEDRFVDEVLYKAEEKPLKKADIDVVLMAVVRLYEITEVELSKPGQDRRLSEARSMAAWGVKEMTSSTLTELSKRISRDITSLSSGEKRLQTRAKGDSELAVRMVDFKGIVEDVAKLQS
ncbi:MAG: transposase [bacterium]|nr:transposase [bacterium]